MFSYQQSVSFFHHTGHHSVLNFSQSLVYIFILIQPLLSSYQYSHIFLTNRTPNLFSCSKFKNICSPRPLAATGSHVTVLADGSRTHSLDFPFLFFFWPDSQTYRCRCNSSLAVTTKMAHGSAGKCTQHYFATVNYPTESTYLNCFSHPPDF